MNSKLRDKMVDELFESVLLLNNIDECYNFFEDLCTIAEIKAMAQRFAVAKMLSAGYTYSEICYKTGASTATVSRVNRSLIYGADGYKMMLEKIKKDDNRS